MKKILGNYIINSNKLDNIMEFLASSDNEVVMVGAGYMKELFGLEHNKIRTSVYSLRTNDEITFVDSDEEGKKYLSEGTVLSIGEHNIVVKTKNGLYSLQKINLKNDRHFSIKTQ